MIFIVGEDCMRLDEEDPSLIHGRTNEMKRKMNSSELVQGWVFWAMPYIPLL